MFRYIDIITCIEQYTPQIIILGEADYRRLYVNYIQVLQHNNNNKKITYNNNKKDKNGEDLSRTAMMLLLLI